MKKVIFLVFIAFTVLFKGCVFSDDNNNPNGFQWNWEPVYNSEHTILGEPFDGDTTDDYMIYRYGLSISYNFNLNVANWVCWNLDKSWIGDASRYNGDFLADNAIPPQKIKIMHSDYTSSGYDRGHIVPSADRTISSFINKETFYLTNIYPQRPDMNQGVWSDFEIFCNNLARNEDKELYICAGGIFESKQTLKNVVTIPDTCYKIVVILENGGTLEDITKDTEIIAVKIPNIDGIRNDNWEKYTTSVDAIEASTGYDFLNLIPDSLEHDLEKNVF